MTNPDSPPPEPPPRRRGRRALVLAILLSPLALFALYTWFALHWDYSNGYRSGMLQKFSQRGWVCKTYEGELWQSVGPNIAPVIWQFSVRDDQVVHGLDSLVGKQVRLHYTEHRGILVNCFGDTRYFVDSVTVVRE